MNLTTEELNRRLAEADREICMLHRSTIELEELGRQILRGVRAQLRETLNPVSETLCDLGRSNIDVAVCGAVATTLYGDACHGRVVDVLASPAAKAILDAERRYYVSVFSCPSERLVRAAIQRAHRVLIAGVEVAIVRLEDLILLATVTKNGGAGEHAARLIRLHRGRIDLNQIRADVEALAADMPDYPVAKRFEEILAYERAMPPTGMPGDLG